MKDLDKEKKKKLKKLIKLMNKKSKRLLPSFLGAIVNVLDSVMTSEEADFLLNVGIDKYTREELRAKLQMDDENFSRLFKSLIHKGLIWSKTTKNGQDIFELSPMMVGWFEMQVADGNENDDDKEFIRNLTKLFNSFKKFNFLGGRTVVNTYYRIGGPKWSVVGMNPSELAAARSVEVNEIIDVPETKIIHAKNLNELLQKFDGKIAVSNCICRQHWLSEGEPCRIDLPRETHMWLGNLALHVAKNGIGRLITKEEAVNIMKEVQQKGGIHEVMHDEMDVNKDELCICNCCWDCCNSLGAYNRGQIPLYLKAYYLATIPNLSKCTGCETCVQFCPVQAMSIKDGKAKPDIKKCIGCGQCEIQCPESAIKLIERERSVFLPVQKLSNCRIKA